MRNPPTPRLRLPTRLLVIDAIGCPGRAGARRIVYQLAGPLAFMANMWPVRRVSVSLC